MKHEHTWESEVENTIGRVVGAVFESILSTLSEEQDIAARDLLRRVVANPNVYRDDKRILAIIAGSTDEQLDELMTELYGPKPLRLSIIQGGNSANACLEGSDAA